LARDGASQQILIGSTRVPRVMFGVPPNIPGRVTNHVADITINAGNALPLGGLFEFQKNVLSIRENLWLNHF
jgi:hypothetical protein